MMANKQIFVLNGNPAETSLSKSFADNYVNSARVKGHDVRVMHISELDFDMDFGFTNFSNPKTLEADLEQFVENLEWCDHFVLATPMWWGGLPAKLKGLFDRALLPGRTFDTRVKKGKMPKPMLQGRTGRVIITSDTPGWIMRLFYKNALMWQLKKQILGFIGIAPTKISWFSGASNVELSTADKWAQQVHKMAAKAV